MKKEKVKNIKSIPKILEQELSGIIIKIAKDYSVQPFIENPDFLEKRLEKWHQFGLLTHTKKVREVFLIELNFMLKNWNIYYYVQKVMTEKKDGIEKNKLFEIGFPLHDLGKIILYKDKRTNREHEIASRDLIYQDFLKNKLNAFGLSNKHIDYIANCVKVHDVIGKEIRDKLKHNKLNLEYISSNEVKIMCKKVGAKYPKIKTELGIFFLCDCLGKIDIKINANTNQEIIKQEPKIMQILEQRNLSPQLKYAIMQLPANIKLAEIYLKNIV